MAVKIKLEEDKGSTLIELLIAAVISSILIAALYRTFISQQRAYNVQDQVVDMQQNVRVAINRMMSEIRMAGFGNISNVLPGGVNGFTQAIVPGANSITIVGGVKQIRRENRDPISVSSSSGTQVILNYATDDFDGAAHRFISIGGFESNTVQSRSGSTLTLGASLNPTLLVPAGTPVFKVQAITYDVGVSDGKSVLRRNENTGGGAQPVAENIVGVGFRYYNAAGGELTPPIAPQDIPTIRIVRVTVTARTNISDPDLKVGDGYRRRQIASNVYLRNIGTL